MRVLSSKALSNTNYCVTKLMIIAIDKKKFQLKVTFIKRRKKYEIDIWDGANMREYKKLRTLFKKEPGIDQKIYDIIKHENTID